MKAASSRTRTRKFLALAATTLAATLTFGTPMSAHADDSGFAYPEGYPKLGAAQEGFHGFNVKSHNSSIPTQLFSVHTRGDKDATIKAYCVELDVGVMFKSDLTVGNWKDFPGTNNFKGNAEVQAKVAWIAQRSYPQTDLKVVAETAGVAGLTDKEAVTATQSAIWHFTNNFQYTGTVSGIDQASATRVQKLYEYLISEKNVGLKETARPTVEFKGATGTSIVTGDKVGPLRFESNQTTVKVTNKLDYELVDANSKKVDLNAVPSGTDLYLKVPAGVTSGEQKFEVSATGSVYAGKLLITKNATTDRHGQTIIIGSNTEVAVSGTASFRWANTPPAPATTPPAPATTPPAPATTPPAPATTPPASATTPPASATTSPAPATTSSADDPAEPITPTSTVTVTAPAPQPSTPAKKPGLPKTGSN